MITATILRTEINISDAISLEESKWYLKLVPARVIIDFNDVSCVEA